MNITQFNQISMVHYILVKCILIIEWVGVHVKFMFVLMANHVRNTYDGKLRRRMIIKCKVIIQVRTIYEVQQGKGRESGDDTN